MRWNFGQPQDRNRRSSKRSDRDRSPLLFFWPWVSEQRWVRGLQTAAIVDSRWRKVLTIVLRAKSACVQTANSASKRACQWHPRAHGPMSHGPHNRYLFIPQAQTHALVCALCVCVWCVCVCVCLNLFVCVSLFLTFAFNVDITSCITWTCLVCASR